MQEPLALWVLVAGKPGVECPRRGTDTEQGMWGGRGSTHQPGRVKREGEAGAEEGNDGPGSDMTAAQVALGDRSARP